MKIRLINEQDWEKVYELDKSIVRVGSQITCDIQIKGKDIQALHLQIVRSGANEPRFVMRTFADNVRINRGDQAFECRQVAPQLLMDGDKISFGSYRMIIHLEDEHTRTRTSQHIAAEMFLQKRELQMDMPINGALKLKNLGTEKGCQFRMHISGIPNECLKSSPLPYLYPGGEGTVGFMITHLQTKPAPGFHTVSITVNAPEEYFGESLEFNQDIYVMPVFDNEIILEDDSEQMNVPEKSDQQVRTPSDSGKAITEDKLSEPDQMNLRQDAIDEPSPVIDRNAAVILGKDKQKGVFEDEDKEEEPIVRRQQKKKKEKVVVIRHDEERERHAFEDISDEEKKKESAEDIVEVTADTVTPDKENHTERSDERVKNIPEYTETKETEPETSAISAEQVAQKTAPVKKKTTAKKTQTTEEPNEKEPAPEKEKKPRKRVSSVAVRSENNSVPSEEKTGLDDLTQSVIAAEAKPESKKVSPETTGTENTDEPIVSETVTSEMEINAGPAEKETDMTAEPGTLLELGTSIRQTAEISSEEDTADVVLSEEAVDITADYAPIEETASGNVPTEETASDDVPAEETVPDDETAEETVSENVPAEETASDDVPAEETVSDDETVSDMVISVPDTAPKGIPVIHGKASFDFDQDISAPIPEEPVKKADVVVMKGGNFDD